MYGPGELDIGRHVLADGTPRPSVSACFFRKVRKPPKKAGEVSCLDTRLDTSGGGIGRWGWILLEVAPRQDS